MYMQYWCPNEEDIVAGDANGVWWQFHEGCDQGIKHETVEFPHMMDLQIWPFEGGEEDVYYRAACTCTYVTTRQAVEMAATRLWWDHYQRAKAQVSDRVDSPTD